MIDGKSVLAIIPARAGSKGLPGKNGLPFAGRPLVVHSIDQAVASRHVDRTVVTTDDAAIMEMARAAGGATVIERPAELATDAAPVADAILHVLDRLDQGFDYIVLLQPTSPLRRPEDIDGCLERCLQSGAPSCLTVTRQEKSPAWMFRLDGDGRMTPVLGWSGATAPRQDLEPVWVLNGAVFVAATPWFRRHRVFLAEETVAHPMPAERSIDIDSALDFRLAEGLAADG